MSSAAITELVVVSVCGKKQRRRSKAARQHWIQLVLHSQALKLVLLQQSKSTRQHWIQPVLHSQVMKRMYLQRLNLPRPVVMSLCWCFRTRSHNPCRSRKRSGCKCSDPYSIAAQGMRKAIGGYVRSRSLWCLA